MQAHVADLKLRVTVEGALVDELKIPFDPDGNHQLEEVDDLTCATTYVIFVSACTTTSDRLGGCGPEINATARTSPCGVPSPPPHPISPPPAPPSPPLPPAAPPSPPVYGLRDHGCKQPNAATYEPDAPVSDASLCVPGIRGCTLSRAVNYNRNANLNDGSCRFAQGSVCAVPLASLAWTTRDDASGLPWPVSVDKSADGTACAIGPAVAFQRCFGLVPPPNKATDVVLETRLPAGAVAATVEAGLSPRAGRDGGAEFELRLVTALGDVVSSSLAVRSRRGQHIPPAVLHVELPEALRGLPGTLLQLVVNDEDGEAGSDLVVWADPLLYCDAGCPCNGHAGVMVDAASAQAIDHGDGTSLAAGTSPPPHMEPQRQAALNIGFALVALGLAICGYKLMRVLFSQLIGSDDVGPLRMADEDDDLVELPAQALGSGTGGRQSRIVGDVRINSKRKVGGDVERRNLMGVLPEDGWEDEDVLVARL